MNSFNLTGKKAIVTGGGKGLGFGIARGLSEAGAEVLIIGRSENVFEAAGRLKGAKAQITDLSDNDSLEENFDKAVTELGGLHILVNNAGLQGRYPAEEFPRETWNDILNVNLNAVFFLCQCAGRHMLKQGYGKIINIASMNSFVTTRNIAAYVASKGAVAQLTKLLANEWAGRGICVNAIAPGYMETDMTAALHGNAQQRTWFQDRIPKGRWGKPEDLAGPAVFLASDASDYVNGVVLPVDGGYLTR